MVGHTLKILEQMLQDFYSVFYVTLCIIGLRTNLLTHWEFLVGRWLLWIWDVFNLPFYPICEKISVTFDKINIFR